jgi:hypothetical protein
LTQISADFTQTGADFFKREIESGEMRRPHIAQKYLRKSTD